MVNYYVGGHPTHKWRQDDEGITSCDYCDTYPHNKEAKLACEWIPPMCGTKLPTVGKK